MTPIDIKKFHLYEWMNATPEIDKLSLNELTLPGTHNAGCDWEASYSDLVTRNWAACQDVSFYSQLNRGSRALDVRLIYDASATGLAKFRFQHSGSWSSRTLADLIRDIKAFLERSFNEFIILDFHELKDGEESFNFKHFNDVMKEHLGDHIIPTANKDLTLGQLKEVNQLQRVLVCTPSDRSLDPNVFGWRIIHQWAGNSWKQATFDTVFHYLRLENHITKVLENPQMNRATWSLSAAVFNAGGPLRMLEKLDEWFDPAKSDWAEKCSIINFDFIKNSKLVYFCYLANLKKASQKPRQV